MKTYIVVYEDGVIMPYRSIPSHEHHQEGSRFFEVDDLIPLYKLQDWIAKGFPENPDWKIKEITKK